MTRIPRAGFTGSILLLLVAQVSALSLWFSTSAVLPALAAEAGVAVAELGGLSTAVQIGFVLGALTMAISGAADRFDPRAVFGLCCVLAAGANAMMLVVPLDSLAALASRALVGAALAGVYPVGLKIAVGWSLTRRGLLSALLVGALTLGTASSHFAALAGAADWRWALAATSCAAVLAALVIPFAGLGPYHQTSPKFSLAVVEDLRRSPGLRRAYFGYFGHMWELYAFWAWIGVIVGAAALSADLAAPERFGSTVAAIAVALGALACIPSGWLADRYGKDRVAEGAMWISGLSAITAAVTFNLDLTLFVAAVMVWGMSIIPDSPQFSAMVADAAPKERVGSLLTLQTALGFALTTITVQGAPVAADVIGWSGVMVVLALGPALGVIALRRKA